MSSPETGKGRLSEKVAPAGATGDGARDMQATGRRVAADAGVLGRSLAHLAEETKIYLEVSLRRHPYHWLLGAAGLGFLLAGGVRWRSAGALAAWGGRILVQDLVARWTPFVDASAATQPTAQPMT